MENVEKGKLPSTPIQEMGEAAKEVFSGKIDNLAIKELYSETATFFAEIIRGRLSPRDNPYEMLDVGSFKGDLIENVLKELGTEYKIDTTGIDINEGALAENKVVDKKVVADISSMPFENNSFDVSEARYVLVWNNPEKQRDILEEISRVTKGFAIVQHAGADDVDTLEWQNAMHNLLLGGVPKLKRQECYFSSVNEIEEWMANSGIKFKRVQHRKVDNVSQVFIEKFKLDKNETAQTLEILGDKDYIYQTTWVIGDVE